MFQIINEKLTFLAEDFDITQHITQHPLEDEFKNMKNLLKPTKPHHLLI